MSKGTNRKKIWRKVFLWQFEKNRKIHQNYPPLSYLKIGDLLYLCIYIYLVNSQTNEQTREQSCANISLEINLELAKLHRITKQENI